VTNAIASATAVCVALAAALTPLTAQLASAQPAVPAAAASRHTHGGGTLDIRFDGRRGTLEFTAAAQSVYGFEREPRTAAERELRANALRTLHSRISDAVIFDPSLGCSVIPGEVHAGNDSHGHASGGSSHAHAFRDERNRMHVDVHGEYAVACAKAPLGQEIRFGFTKLFPSLRTVDVRVRVANRDTSFRIDADRGTVRP
jgi:hypothetical protein